MKNYLRNKIENISDLTLELCRGENSPSSSVISRIVIENEMIASPNGHRLH